MLEELYINATQDNLGSSKMFACCDNQKALEVTGFGNKLQNLSELRGNKSDVDDTDFGNNLQKKLKWACAGQGDDINVSNASDDHCRYLVKLKATGHIARQGCERDKAQAKYARGFVSATLILIAQKSIAFVRCLPVFLIDVYRACVSPFKCPCCRFRPTCSQYAKEALQKYSFFYAILLISKRLLKCQPWGGSGYDPVPEPKRKKRNEK